MFSRSWIRARLAPARRPVRQARAPCRPAVEMLEDRALPAVAFHPAVPYGAGDGPLSVAMGDFNGDGQQDLAVANNVSNNVSVLLGQGNGTFAGTGNYTVRDGPCSLAVGDFNGDGHQDLAVANRRSNNVSVLLGDGTGTFAGAVNYAAGVFPFSVVVGDFNGDGQSDLAVANFGNDNVSVLL